MKCRKRLPVINGKAVESMKRTLTVRSSKFHQSRDKDQIDDTFDIIIEMAITDATVHQPACNQEVESMQH